MGDEWMKTEIKEAITAGDRALESLENAAEKLKSARNWGMFDILGGGFVSTLVKHSKMDAAVDYMEDAKYHLQIFQKELKDIHVPADFRLEIGKFLTFTDLFVDDIFSDCIVQSRISETRTQVDEAICQVRYILSDLHRLLNSETEV